MKIAFITRTTAKTEKDLKKTEIEKLIKAVWRSKIKNIYFLAKEPINNCKIADIPNSNRNAKG